MKRDYDRLDSLIRYLAIGTVAGFCAALAKIASEHFAFNQVFDAICGNGSASKEHAINGRLQTISVLAKKRANN